MRPVRRAGLVLGVGCKLFSSSKKLRGLSVRALARRISISLSFSVVGVSSFPSPPQRDEARRAEVQYRAPVRGALCLSSTAHFGRKWGQRIELPLPVHPARPVEEGVALLTYSVYYSATIPSEAKV